MFSSSSNLQSVIGDFRIDSMMRYSLFVPRLYNLCKSLGFEAGKIMPSRAFRSIVKEKRYRDKRMVFVSCLNIDISPREGQTFPVTKCVPWAAYIQDGKGNHHTLEQVELTAQLHEQSTDNPDQIDLEDAIHRMEEEQEIRIVV